MSNTRAALLMVLSMAFFAGEDGFIKHLAGAMPVGQVLLLLGLLGGSVFWLALLAKGGRLWTRDLLHPMVILRNLGELFGAFGYILAVALTPLSSASAILQAIPLVVVMAAALFLGEQVGWRRWSAVVLGGIGVLLVLQPGLTGFRPASLFALLAVFALATRDIATRRMPGHIRSEQLSASAFFAVALLGPPMIWAMGDAYVMPTAGQALTVILASGFGVLGYIAIVAATRHGDISAIAPFRYARLVFGMLVGIIFFAERPNTLTYLGALVIVLAGIYAIWRESQLKRASKAAQASL